MEKDKRENKAAGTGAFSAFTGTEDLLVLYGNTRLCVRGCEKILLYSKEEIRLRLRRKGRQLCIIGEDLQCVSFSGGSVTVVGRIRILSYPEKEGKTSC